MPAVRVELAAGAAMYLAVVRRGGPKPLVLLWFRAWVARSRGYCTSKQEAKTDLRVVARGAAGMRMGLHDLEALATWNFTIQV